MKVRVICPEKLAIESHRKNTEEVDVDMNDTIDDVKIKITMVYTSLDPESFYLSLNNQKLPNTETILNIMKRNQNNP